MKLNFDTVLLDLDGKPLVSDTGPLSLKAVALTSLLAMFPDEQQLAGDEKAARFALAVRVNAGGELDLTPEEVSKVKLLVGKCYSALVVGRAYELLNG